MKTNPLGVGFKVKDFFFDAPAVVNAIDPKERKFLSKFGAFVRTRAKRSIRPGGKSNIVSRPGEPPRSHGDSKLRKNIFFTADFKTANKNVIIGPIVLNHVFFGNTVPEVLEEGGSITVLEALYNVPGKGEVWMRADLRSRRRLAAKKTRRRTVNIEARPFMGPAFEAEKKNISTIWRSA